MAYTPDEIKDIQEREAKGLAALKELQLNPAASVQKQNIGNDVFVDKVIPYLQDTKFSPTPSVTSDEVKQDKPTKKAE